MARIDEAAHVAAVSSDDRVEQGVKCCGDCSDCPHVNLRDHSALHAAHQLSRHLRLDSDLALRSLLSQANRPKSPADGGIVHERILPRRPYR